MVEQDQSKGSWGKNVVTFVGDMRSSVHVDNKKIYQFLLKVQHKY